jgi:hypothetical protein
METQLLRGSYGLDDVRSMKYGFTSNHVIKGSDTLPILCGMLIWGYKSGIKEDKPIQL